MIEKVTEEVVKENVVRIALTGRTLTELLRTERTWWLHFLKNPDYFYKVCTKVFNQYAPRKKYVRGDNKWVMNNGVI